jgi:hypothetical protein
VEGLLLFDERREGDLREALTHVNALAAAGMVNHSAPECCCYSDSHGCGWLRNSRERAGYDAVVLETGVLRGL